MTGRRGEGGPTRADLSERCPESLSRRGPTLGNPPPSLFRGHTQGPGASVHLARRLPLLLAGDPLRLLLSELRGPPELRRRCLVLKAAPGSGGGGGGHGKVRSEESSLTCFGR